MTTPLTILEGDALPNKSVRDWPEDFEYENGNYLNKCLICEQTFVGHKCRTWCKACAAALLKNLNTAP